jgi:hypothetical protein
MFVEVVALTRGSERLRFPLQDILKAETRRGSFSRIRAIMIPEANGGLDPQFAVCIRQVQIRHGLQRGPDYSRPSTIQWERHDEIGQLGGVFVAGGIRWRFRGIGCGGR